MAEVDSLATLIERFALNPLERLTLKVSISENLRAHVLRALVKSSEILGLCIPGFKKVSNTL